MAHVQRFIQRWAGVWQGARGEGRGRKERGARVPLDAVHFKLEWDNGVIKRLAPKLYQDGSSSVRAEFGSKLKTLGNYFLSSVYINRNRERSVCVLVITHSDYL